MGSAKEKSAKKKIGGLRGGILQYLFTVLLFFGGLWAVKNYVYERRGVGFLTVLCFVILFIVLTVIQNSMKKKYRKTKVSALDDGWIQFLISDRLITVVIPAIVMSVIFLSQGTGKVSFWESTLAFLGIFFGSLVYDKAVRGLFDYVYLKYRNDNGAAVWLSFLTIFASFLTLVGVIYGATKTLPSLSLMLFLLITEGYTQYSYLRGGWIYTNSLSRMTSYATRAFLALVVFWPILTKDSYSIDTFVVPNFVLYGNGALLLILFVVMCFKYVSFDNKCYEAVESFGLSKEEKYSYADIFKAKKKTGVNKVRFGEEANIVRYVVMSALAIAIVFGIYYGLRYFFPFDGTIEFIRNEGAELLSTMISSIFLIVSFLTFLGDRDDKILWTDMRSFRLVNPHVMNFIGLSVFSFASLAATTIAFVLKDDVLVIAFFLIGLFFQTYLTFLVIISYFRREETIRMLKNYAITILGDPDKTDDWEDVWEGIYENSCILAEDKNWAKLQENYDFIVSLYGCVRNVVIRDDYSRKTTGSSIGFDNSTELYAMLLRKSGGAEDRVYSEQVLKKLEKCIAQILLLVKDDAVVGGRLIRHNKTSLHVPVVMDMVADKAKAGETRRELIHEDLESLEEASKIKKGLAKKKVTISLSIGDVELGFSSRDAEAVDKAIGYLLDLCANNYEPD